MPYGERAPPGERDLPPAGLVELGSLDVTVTVNDLPSALARHDELAARIEGKRIAVFLDFDGTLAPVVDRPGMAALTDAMRDIVRDLADRCPVTIVSGRDRNDVRKIVGLPKLIYAGSHGFDISGHAGRPIRHREGSEFHTELVEVAKTLRRRLKAVKGALIEPKAVSVAVHFRLVASAARTTVREEVDRILADHPRLRVIPGKMIYEIQPRLDWNKGNAVLWLLEKLHLDGPDAVPVYIGDDVTDEDAFAAIDGRGIGIFVGGLGGSDPGRRTAASYQVEDPQEVGLLLRFIAERT